MKLTFSFFPSGLLLGGLLTLITANYCWGQEVPLDKALAPRHVLKTAPLLFNEVNVSYELLRRPDRSWQFGLGYVHQAYLDAGSAGEPVAKKVNGFTMRVSHRSYTSSGSNLMQGRYRGPMLMYRYMSIPQLQRDYRLFQQMASLSYIWGKQRVYWNWLVLDGYVGLGGRIKYAYEQGGEPNENMYGNSFYGYRASAGPDWVILLGPSVHLNLAVGVAF